MSQATLLAVKNTENCPDCGAELVIRSGKHGPFLGCSRYPECQFIRPLKPQADGHVVVEVSFSLEGDTNRENLVIGYDLKSFGALALRGDEW